MIVDLTYRSAQWRHYWKERRKQIEKLTVLRISFWRLQPGYTQQERFHQHVKEALKLRKSRYCRVLRRLADSDAENKYRQCHDFVEMAEDNCATTVRSARDLLSQEKALFSRAIKWEDDPSDPCELPPPRQRDFVADLELEGGL